MEISSSPMKRTTAKRTTAKYTLLLVLLIGLLALAACDQNPEPAPAPGVEVTPVTEDEADTPTPAPDVADPNDVTDEVTATEGITGTDVVTDSDAITDTGIVTDTGVATDTQGTTTGDTGISGADGALVRSSTLTNYDFTNQDGAISGNVDDFLVDITSGDVLFAFVEYGGFLDIGDTNLVMPLNAFQWGNDQLILNFDEQELENFPSVSDTWPDIADPAWDDEVNTFWSNIDLDPSLDFDGSNSAGVMWLSDMTGYVLADLGQGTGTIQDTLIDLGNSRIKYVLFGFGATAADGDPYIVPYEALDIQNIGNNEILFDAGIDLTTLQTAPRYDRNLYPDAEVLTTDFSTAIDEYWRTQGFDINE